MRCLEIASFASANRILPTVDSSEEVAAIQRLPALSQNSQTITDPVRFLLAEQVKLWFSNMLVCRSSLTENRSETGRTWEQRAVLNLKKESNLFKSCLMGRTSVKDFGQNNTFPAHQQQPGVAARGLRDTAGAHAPHTWIRLQCQWCFEIVSWARNKQKITRFMPKAATLTAEWERERISSFIQLTKNNTCIYQVQKTGKSFIMCA